MINSFDPSQPVSGYKPDKYERDALDIMITEKRSWDDAAVFVTHKEQYLMRLVIEQSRRYYSGIFENRYDEITGHKKTWVPLTKSSVESVVKSIDLDTKDILIQPKRLSAVNIAPYAKASINALFDDIKFGQLLNDLTRVMAIDGTVIVKTQIDRNPYTKQKFIRSDIVDLLNFWIDPTAKDVQEGPVIQREYMSEANIKSYEGTWTNLEFTSYSKQIKKVADMYNVAPVGTIPYTEVWERWGPVRKSLITKNDKDHDTWVESHMVASGLGGPQILHFIRKNPREDGRKPFEECWYRRLPRRWYGEGIPEMLFDLQEYANMVVNIRKANNMVLQNGIFLIRKGSGITPDMLNSITAGGGLPVTNVNNDIKQLDVQDFRQSSYTDEDRVQLMADRVTNSFDINRGEAGKASASATATLTQDRNIRDAFVLVQEGMGFFITRLIKNQYIPLMKEMWKKDDWIKVTGDSDFLSAIDEQIVTNRENKFISDYQGENGFRPETGDIQKFVSRQYKFLRKMGKQRFVKYIKDMFDEQFDIEVHVTDEKFNRVVAVQQLRDALIAHSRIPTESKLDTDAILREMFNIMGIKGDFFLEKAKLPNYNPEQGGPRLLQEFAEELPNEVTAFENANKIPQQQQVQIQNPLESKLNINTQLSSLQPQR